MEPFNIFHSIQWDLSFLINGSISSPPPVAGPWSMLFYIIVLYYIFRVRVTFLDDLDNFSCTGRTVPSPCFVPFTIFTLYHKADSGLVCLQWLTDVKLINYHPSHHCVTPIYATEYKLNKTNKQMQLSELQASKQTRTDVLIATRQICYGKTFCAPLYSLRWNVFLALCLPTCTSAFSRICRGRSPVKTSLVTVLKYSHSSFDWKYFDYLTSRYQLPAKCIFAVQRWKVKHLAHTGQY